MSFWAELAKAAGLGFLGDEAMKRTGLGDRASGILDDAGQYLSDIGNAIIPPAAASDASTIPQQPVVPDVPANLADTGTPLISLTPQMGSAASDNEMPFVGGGRPTQLPDMQMQKTPDDIARETQDFVRMVGGRTQNLMQETPEGNPQEAAALATTEAIAAKGMQDDDGGFFDSVGGFLTDLFGDEERMTRMALAFNSMRLQPDQGLAAVLGKRLETLDTRRTTTLTANKTVEALRRVGTPQAMKFAAMIEANPSMAKEIYKEYVKSSGAGFDKDIVKGESDLRKEFTGLPTVKDFQSQSTAFGRVVASAKDPSAAGDLALIFNYMKVLDPGSTVREGEFATAQNASGVPGRVQSLYNNIIRGERLNEEQRGDFVDRARRLYKAAATSYEGIRDDYVDIASSYKFDVKRTVPDLFSQQKDIVDPPKPSYGSLPDSVKSKYSADDFDKLWNGMSYLTKLQLSGS